MAESRGKPWRAMLGSMDRMPGVAARTKGRSAFDALYAFDSAFSDNLMPSDMPVPAGTFLMAASASFSE
jgi:hypothetical protein